MYANEYDEAAEIFEAYLDAHSGIYWKWWKNSMDVVQN